MFNRLKISPPIVVLCACLTSTSLQSYGQGRIPTLINPNLSPSAQGGTAIAALGPVALGATTADVIAALGLNPSDVISISFGSSSAAGYGVLTTSAASLPSQGSDYLALSTGAASSAFLPNSEGNLSTELDGLNTAQGQDLTQLVIQLRPPAGATCLAFDFAFLSEEFPEFVGSQFNDAFIAEIGQSTFQQVGNQIIAPNNFAFDAANHVISVNTVFGVTAGAAAGTTYDGGTPLLTAVTPLEDPTQPITITLSIMDLGDSIYDSTAFIDNFRWFYGLDCRPGADADSDGDALLDDWERNGIDFDRDGTVDLDLPAMGADPNHKDIFVEIDYMVLAGAGGHTHKPKLEALATVIEAFNNAPVTNPDGTTGIHIHIDGGADTIMNPVTGELWGARSRSDVLAHVNNLGTMSGVNYNWAAFDVVKGVGTAGSFSVQRADVFHYCIFGHSLAPELTTTSGISRGIPASDFLVTLGGWTGNVGSVNEQAGTFMHELGHGLGLFHGGDDPLGNREPNYLSIMSYSFQTRGLRFGGADGKFDYSRFTLPSLNESSLNENIGLSGVAEAAGYGTRFKSGGVDRIANDINVAIDWNSDGDSTDNPVAVDLNGSGSLSVLNNSDNWDEIVFDGGSVGHLGEAITLPETSEAVEITELEDLGIPTEFKVTIGGPGAVYLEVCQTETYAYTVVNKGDLADTYLLFVSSIQDWADTSSIPGTLELASGESAVFNVPVAIPSDGLPGEMDKLKIEVVSISNPAFQDVVLTVTTLAVPGDQDNDGFPDFCDACPNSDTRPTIVIKDCDTLVPNHLFQDGCTMADLISEAASTAANHGAFVNSVTALAIQWKKDNLITGNQQGKIVSCAAKAAIP